jgi:tetratricopeptide (TPR) repeat protein
LLRDMVQRQPDRADAALALADIYRENRRYPEAISAYDEAIGRMPRLEHQHWPVLYGRAIAHKRMEQWSAAEADFLHALALEPEQPFVLNYLGYSWVERGTNIDRAKSMIERAVELRPGDGYIIDSLGWVLYQLGEYEGAVRHLERATELQPDDPTINDHLGDAYWLAGRRHEARFQWQRALTFKPEPDLQARLEDKLNGQNLPHFQNASAREN